MNHGLPSNKMMAEPRISYSIQDSWLNVRQAPTRGISSGYVCCPHGEVRQRGATVWGVLIFRRVGFRLTIKGNMNNGDTWISWESEYMISSVHLLDYGGNGSSMCNMSCGHDSDWVDGTNLHELESGMVCSNL